MNATVRREQRLATLRQRHPGAMTPAEASAALGIAQSCFFIQTYLAHVKPVAKEHNIALYAHADVEAVRAILTRERQARQRNREAREAQRWQPSVELACCGRWWPVKAVPWRCPQCGTGWLQTQEASEYGTL